MATPKDIIAELDRIELIEAIKNSKDFSLLVDIFEDVLTAFAKERKLNDAQRAELESAMAAVRLKKGERGERGEKGERGPRGEDGQTIRGPRGEAGPQGERGEAGAKGEAGPQGEKGADGINGSPDTGLQIVDKINELPTDEDKYLIDIEHIDGLKKWLKRLEANITSSGSSSTTTGISGRGRVKNYDLSSRLDGVTKTFTLPANWQVINVAASSFPSVLRPLIDYTYTTTSITFTSEITASTTLAAGQTLIIVYEEG